LSSLVKSFLSCSCSCTLDKLSIDDCSSTFSRAGCCRVESEFPVQVQGSTIEAIE
jgi:hypothetical protein